MSVTGTLAGNFTIAITTLGPVFALLAFQFMGTSKRAHWKPSKHAVYSRCLVGFI